MAKSGVAPAKVKSYRMSGVLQSWEEIAHYLNSGVRSVQRWEITAGLPVRHLRDSGRGPVFAFPDELNEWSRGRVSRDFD
jgi:hypothetical protein